MLDKKRTQSTVKILRSPIKMWGDVIKYSSSVKCHVCESDKKVKVGTIRHNYEFGHIPLPTPNPAKWKLCQQCYDLGWRLENAYNGSLTYMIYKTKSVRIID